MGNASGACLVTNHSKRAIRVIVTPHSLVIDDVLTSESKHDEHDSSGPPADKKFIFRKDVHSIRILPSQSNEVKYEPQQYMNIFAEDEEHNDGCSKQVMHNMVMSAPLTVLLYDV